MSADDYWLRELSKSESKARGSGTGRSLRLSSIDGWSEKNLPKLLIVWTFDKRSSEGFSSNTRPGRFSKRRDLSGTVTEYEVFLIDSADYIVPWNETPSHAELVTKHWTAEWIAELKQKAGALNRTYKDRPINFQLSFKNGKYLRLQYGVNNYQKLPPCPVSVSKILAPELDSLIGCEFKLHKDHSPRRGPGWFDNEMARWEHENRKKDSGKLWYRIPRQEWETLDSFSEGRQDFWLGFAIEHLMAKLLSRFDDQGGHQTGFDHRVDLGNIAPDAPGSRLGLFDDVVHPVDDWWNHPKYSGLEPSVIELFETIKKGVESGGLPESATPEKPEPAKPLSEAQRERITRENHRLYGVGDTHQVQRCSICREQGHNRRTCAQATGNPDACPDCPLDGCTCGYEERARKEKIQNENIR